MFYKKIRTPLAHIFIILALVFSFACGQTTVSDSTSNDSTEDSSENTTENSDENSNEDSEDNSADNATEDSNNNNNNVDSAEDDSEADEGTSEKGVLYGFWGLNGFHDADELLDIKTRFGTTVFQVTSAYYSSVTDFLDTINKSGMKVSMTMAGGHSHYTDSNGDFDIEMWKDQIDEWENSDVQDYIDDGILVGHLILDDIYNFDVDPTASELDEMAEYSQAAFPGLLTIVRQKASGMPVPNNGVYEFVDAVVNQYKAEDGDVDDYAQDENDAAIALDLEVIFGLNLCDGGNGDSGQPGWRDDKVTYAMTADEIVTYGAALLNVPNLKMFLMWEFDGEELWPDGTIGSDYFEQSDLEAAFLELSILAADYESN
jgi:hypothetical protein